MLLESSRMSWRKRKEWGKSSTLISIIQTRTLFSFRALAYSLNPCIDSLFSAWMNWSFRKNCAGNPVEEKRQKRKALFLFVSFLPRSIDALSGISRPPHSYSGQTLFVFLSHLPRNGLKVVTHRNLHDFLLFPERTTSYHTPLMSKVKSESDFSVPSLRKLG